MILYHEPHAGCRQWLSNLIEAGELPNGEIRAVADVRGARRAHLYAGIGTWELALQRGGWPVDAPVVTAAVPYSSHGFDYRGGTDERRARMRDEILAAINVVEGAALFICISEAALYSGWYDALFVALADSGYAAWAAVLTAAGAGAPHERARAWIVAYPNARGRIAHGGDEGHGAPMRGGANAAWTDVAWRVCADYKTRPVGAGVRCMADGDPGDLVESCADGGQRYNRRVALHGLGLSIVPAVGARFVAAARHLL